MRITARSTLRSVAMQVGDALRRHRIPAVLTGGACASLHSGGAYVSVDMDFILLGHVTQPALDAAMGAVGFRRSGDRYLHRHARFYVEVPRGPLAVGGDSRIGRARALALSPTDSCRDRLAAFYHWNDRQSLAVAVSIALHNRVNLAAIRRWSVAEGAAGQLDEFLRELRQARAPRTRRAGGRGSVGGR